MIHLVHGRSTNTLKVYGRDHSLWNLFAAGGDAWGNHGDGVADNPPPWGTNCWIPIGHYILGPVQYFDEPIISEGFGQIPISDIDAASMASLVQAGYATANGLTATIGGIEAPLAQLAEYDRSALFVHGGGSNAPEPLADNQGLYRTEGCPRMENIDWKSLAAYLSPLSSGNVIVYSALETPADLGQ